MRGAAFPAGETPIASSGSADARKGGYEATREIRELKEKNKNPCDRPTADAHRRPACQPRPRMDEFSQAVIQTLRALSQLSRREEAALKKPDTLSFSTDDRRFSSIPLCRIPTERS